MTPDPDTSSSSSEDQPLITHKEALASGTKRKAEVLSKESGKIGVTIKTSPSPENPSTSAIKVSFNLSESATPVAVATPEHNKQPVLAPLSPETPASRPESDTPAAEQAPIPSPANDNGEGVAQLDAAAPSAAKKANLNVLQETPQHHIPPVSPRTAAPRLWLPKSRRAEHIFITDVTVNLETVTIRECKTEQGFFRDRPMTKDEHHQAEQLQHWVAEPIRSTALALQYFSTKSDNRQTIMMSLLRVFILCEFYCFRICVGLHWTQLVMFRFFLCKITKRKLSFLLRKSNAFRIFAGKFTCLFVRNDITITRCRHCGMIHALTNCINNKTQIK